VFVLDPSGVGLLLKMPKDGSWASVAWIGVTACIGIAALAAGTQKWLLTECTAIERWLLVACGLLLVYPARASDLVGLVGVAVVLALQIRKRRRRARA